MMRERGDWGRERGGHSRLDRRARGQKARAQFMMVGFWLTLPGHEGSHLMMYRTLMPLSCLAGSARSCCILPLSLRPFALRPLLRPLLLDAAGRAAASLQRLATRCMFEKSRRSRRPRPRPHRHPRPRAPPTPPSALLSRCPHPRAAPRRSRRCACVTCTRACVVRGRGGAAHSETPSTALAAVAPASFAWSKTIDGPLSGPRRPNSSEAGARRWRSTRPY